MPEARVSSTLAGTVTPLRIMARASTRMRSRRSTPPKPKQPPREVGGRTVTLLVSDCSVTSRCCMQPSAVVRTDDCSRRDFARCHGY
jgi:hypothetical protein